MYVCVCVSVFDLMCLYVLCVCALLCGVVWFVCFLLFILCGFVGVSFGLMRLSVLCMS